MIDGKILGMAETAEHILLYVRDEKGYEHHVKVEPTNYKIKLNDDITLGQNCVIWKRPGKEVTLAYAQEKK